MAPNIRRSYVLLNSTSIFQNSLLRIQKIVLTSFRTSFFNSDPLEADFWRAANSVSSLSCIVFLVCSSKIYEDKIHFRALKSGLSKIIELLLTSYSVTRFAIFPRAGRPKWMTCLMKLDCSLISS